MSTTRYKFGLLVFCSAIGAVAAFTAGRAKPGSAVTDEYTGASLSYGEQTTQASAQTDVVPTTFSSSVDGARLLEASATAIEADPRWGCMSSSIVCTTKCAVVGSGSHCTGWVNGEGSAKTVDNACKAAK